VAWEELTVGLYPLGLRDLMGQKERIKVDFLRCVSILCIWSSVIPCLYGDFLTSTECTEDGGNTSSSEFHGSPLEGEQNSYALS
jgi:hypothetical protein